MASKSIEGRNTPLSRIDITIHCVIIASAIVRVVAVGSAGAIHTQVALYTWTLDLTSMVAIVGYDIATAEPGTMPLASVLATRQIWTELGAYLLVGVGLRVNLDEVREVDLKALQRRVVRYRSVTAEKRQGCERRRGVGVKGQVEEKEEEEEEEDEKPLALRNLLGTTWIAPRVVLYVWSVSEQRENRHYNRELPL
ncbi:MAG: hypothetical protein J3R72DRAFT_101857 [Linnemannia gamsii]|nr:MAG: hypothetical protein J3R72DRAFT_101857 [Linnemannia gamsii]